MRQYPKNQQTPMVETVIFLVLSVALAIGASVAKNFGYTVVYALARLLSIFAAVAFAVCGVVVVIIVVRRLR